MICNENRQKRYSTALHGARFGRYQENHLENKATNLSCQREEVNIVSTKIMMETRSCEYSEGKEFVWSVLDNAILLDN
jgi:hypothetical protein